MKRTSAALGVAGICILALLVSGCISSAPRGPQGMSDENYRGDSDNAETDQHTDASSTSYNELTTVDPDAPAAEVRPESLAREMLAEAQALFATGVSANHDGRWYDAQVAFEQATGIIADIDASTGIGTADIDPAINEALNKELELLLQDVAGEYRKTLAAIGDLDSDASLLAFLLRYESLESIKGEVEYDSTTLVETDAEESSGQVEYNFPIEMNEQVSNCVVYFQTVGRDPFETYLRRSGKYLPMMKEIVASYGLPTDIAYLPLIESGFNPRAYSYAHASGPWQFISSTGRKYGLDRTMWVDERRDFEKATHSACRYLKDLYEMFDSWTLAFAAYNGGEGRVGRQIKRQNTRDYWKLRLHRQTRNYVPLFMAGLLIAKDPESYGFQVEYDPPLEWDWVATNKPLELKDVARALSVDKRVIADLNPELRRDVTPPDIKPYRLRVPKGKGDLFASVYHSLPESERTNFVIHTVRRGQTLSGIARRYGVRASEIAAHNKLRSKHFLRVGQRLEIPVPSAAIAHYNSHSSSSSSKKSSSSSSSSGSKYRVKRGDTLWDLAKKFGTTTSAIRRANKMSAHSKLIAGRTITIPGRGSSNSGSFWYTIRRGDTFTRIAKRYGIDLNSLKASNSSVNPDRIYVGQRILIPSL
ncbi:MAG: LysM peptidoglycan-binding domain-containing protein [candidate division Zixibacteria bacterium]|nr:LysM peptidoglycan-binding domain-containing protein [candidate division Zixibacteria bacterium]